MKKNKAKELLLEELRQVCQSLEFDVRFERGDFEGGACILRERRLIVINKRFPLEKRVAVLARALGEIGIDGVFMKPAVREFIEEEMTRSTA